MMKIGRHYSFFDEDIILLGMTEDYALIEYDGKEYALKKTGEIISSDTYTLKMIQDSSDEENEFEGVYLENFLGEKIDIKSEYNPKLTVDGTIINLDSYICRYNEDNEGKSYILLVQENLREYNDKIATITITINGKEISLTGKIRTMTTQY